MRKLIETKYWEYHTKNGISPEYVVMNDKDEENLQAECAFLVVQGQGHIFSKYMGMLIIPTDKQPRNTCHVYSLRD